MKGFKGLFGKQRRGGGGEGGGAEQGMDVLFLFGRCGGGRVVVISAKQRG